MAIRRLRVSQQRRKHILNGDVTGGGHGPGRNTPAKSEFPASLTDDDIIDGIERIANDPTKYPKGTIPTSGPRIKIVGDIQGVAAVVIVDPAKNEVITSWPKDILPNS